MPEQDHETPPESATVRTARKIDKAVGKTLGTAKRIYNAASRNGADAVLGSKAATLKKIDEV